MDEGVAFDLEGLTSLPMPSFEDTDVEAIVLDVADAVDVDDVPTPGSRM